MYDVPVEFLPSPPSSELPLGNALVLGRHLHSTRDPVREGERLAATIAGRSAPERALVVIGLGCGYGLARAVTNATGPLIFFEPLPQLLRRLLRTRQPPFQSDRPVGTPDELRQALAALTTDQPSLQVDLLVTPSYARLFPELETRLKNALTPGKDPTLRRFFRRWLRLALRDLSAADAQDSWPYLTLPDPSPADGEQPAVLFCGAGPGLLSDLARHADAIRKGGLFIAVADTALAPVLSAGLTPHVILSIDSGPGTAFHFRAGLAVLRSQARDASALDKTWTLTWAGGPRWLPLGRRLRFRSSFPSDQMLGAPGGPLETAPEFENPGGNALGAALVVARALGADRLFTLGADMRLDHQGRSHERGTGYALYAREGCSRVQSVLAYQPGGYAAELTQKNRRAAEAASTVAQDRGIRICSLGPPEPVPMGATPELPVVVVKRTRLARALESGYERFRKQVAGDFGQALGKDQAAAERFLTRMAPESD